MKSSQTDRGALALMAVTVTLWGFSWIVMKHLTTDIGPFDLVMVRYAIAFLALLPIVVLKRESLAFPPFWPMVGIAVFQTAAFQCLCQLALVSGGAGHVVTLAYTMPFWVVVFVWLILGDRPSRRHVLAFLLAGVGLLGIIAPWEGLGSMTASLLALGGGMSWGLGTVIAKILFQRHAPKVLSVAMWQMFLGAVLTWPVTLIFPQQAINWQAELLWGLAYMGVIASAMGWLLWLSVVQRVSATVAGMSSLGVPVLTVILAWAILAERPTLLEFGGIVFILLGLVIMNLPSRKGRAARRKKAAEAA